MNKYYTKVLPEYKAKINEAKTWMFKIDPSLKLKKEETKKRLVEFIRKYGEGISDPNERGAMTAGLLIAMVDMDGYSIHYYIEDDALVQFLKDTEVKHPDSCSITKAEDQNYFIVHTHTDCYVFVNILTLEKEHYIVAFNKKGYVIFNPESKKFQKMLRKLDTTGAETARLGLNFAFYADAFPDVIREGLPSDMCKSDRQAAKAKDNCVVGISEKIIDVTRSTKTPHFRCGFFRTYYADRYVNMKGKTQFIEATVINKDKSQTMVTK